MSETALGLTVLMLLMIFFIGEYIYPLLRDLTKD